jgi:hypothetical protein
MTTVEAITAALGGRWRLGRGGMARCPCHHDRTLSLSIRNGYEGKVLVYCIETCLAAMQATGNSARAAHSTLPLDLPDAVRNVIADGNHALRAALVAGWRAPNPGGAA